MPWTVEHESPDEPGHGTTHRKDSDASHALEVQHNPTPHFNTDTSTHVVVIHHGEGRLGSMRWPTTQHGAARSWVFTGSGGHYADPPSPELRTMIERHGAHPDTWIPLVDKLAEEYQSLIPAVDAHIRARTE